MASYKRAGPQRRMNNMNGDYLSQLKEPLRSEMNRTVVGTNKAVIALMNKSLDLCFKEQNINVEMMRRRQGDIYATMLRVHREKKILQKAMHQRNQEDTRRKLQEAPQALPAILREKPNKADDADDVQQDNNDKRKSKDIDGKTDAKQEEVKAPDNSTTNGKPVTKGADKDSKDTQITQEQSPKGSEPSPGAKPRERRSKVLEVSKRTPLAPIVRERSNLTSDVTTPARPEDVRQPSTSKAPSNRKSSVTSLSEGFSQTARELSVSDIAIATVAEAQTQPSEERKDTKEDHQTTRSDNGRLSPPAQNKASNKRSSCKASDVMPTICEKDGGGPREIQINRSDSSSTEDKTPKKKPRRTRKKPPVVVKDDQASDAPPDNGEHETSTDQDSDAQKRAAVDDTNPESNVPEKDKQSHAKVFSIAQRNRRRARKKLRNRHKILNEEKFSLYVKAPDGTYQPALLQFQRREFAPPSMKEKHFQEKMLRAEMEARVDQRNKLENFFERMAQEERERQKLREAFKKAKEQEAEEARRKLAEQEQKLGFSASQMATMYSRGILPPGVDPASFEAIAYCKYIRTYSPPGRNDLSQADTKPRQKAHSSWS